MKIFNAFLGQIKRQIEGSAKKLLARFDEIAPVLAKNGMLSAQFDHQCLGHVSQETNLNTLGVLLGTGLFLVQTCKSE